MWTQVWEENTNTGRLLVNRKWENAAPTCAERDIWGGKYRRLRLRGKTMRRRGTARGGEERRGGGAEVILQQRVQYVCPMKPSNTVSTLSVTTSECTITFYKGRMKCQNWFERGGLRYKWAAKVAILFHWPFIPRVPGSLAGEKKKEKRAARTWSRCGRPSRESPVTACEMKTTHTHTHTKQAEIKEEKEEEKKKTGARKRQRSRLNFPPLCK